MNASGASVTSNDDCSRQRPGFTDPSRIAGVTPVRAVHLSELRADLRALESRRL